MTLYHKGTEIKREEEKELTEPIRPTEFIETVYNGTLSAMEWLKTEITRRQEKGDAREMMIVNNQKGALILRYV